MSCGQAAAEGWGAGPQACGRGAHQVLERRRDRVLGRVVLGRHELVRVAALQVGHARVVHALDLCDHLGAQLALPDAKVDLLGARRHPVLVDLRDALHAKLRYAGACGEDEVRPSTRSGRGARSRRPRAQAQGEKGGQLAPAPQTRGAGRAAAEARRPRGGKGAELTLLASSLKLSAAPSFAVSTVPASMSAFSVS